MWIRLHSLNNPELMQPTRQKCLKIEKYTQTTDSCFNPESRKAEDIISLMFYLHDGNKMVF